MNASKSRKIKGDCLFECAAGGIILVVVGLFLLNGVALIWANCVHDRVAFNAARAAASVQQASASQAAQEQVLRQPVRKPIIQSIQLLNVSYYPNQRVEATTQMTVGLPAPIFGLPKTLTFKARSVVAAVADPPIKYQ